ncbi:FAD-dependent monooxygenase [Dongia soli]|uniref:FAD-dependent monooxygenase n=1 Tax=Dongia soli TaxID=600628 RepID=A0ABU5ECA9_9PROT|nr:FAD-dependent monooxygenase [Dongia soli]MDY0883990.1 FAD-dependent monooxygenase [Dongia soli]
MRPQVLVVGAGPVGLTMAAELARYGVGLRIIDKAPQPTDKSKAVVVWSRTLEMLDGMGCAESFIQAGIAARAAHLIDATEQAVQVDFSLLASPFPYALMLPQSETERLLREHLDTFGVQIERPTELLSLQQNEGSVDVTLRHGDGNQEKFPVDWVIGCDGTRSTVRDLIGQSFGGRSFPTEWLMADLRLTGLRTPSGEPALYFHSDGILALFPIGPDNLFRLAANLGSVVEERQGDNMTLAQIQELIERRGPNGLKATTAYWHGTFQVHERQVRSYRSKRVFLAGDAAHVHSPAGGQGMNTGMQDAANLAWKLAMICRGDADSRLLLESYHPERSDVGERTLRVAGRMTWLGLLRHPVAQFLRNRIASAIMERRLVQRFLARQLAGLTVRYRRSPLNGYGLNGSAQEPKVGYRYPAWSSTTIKRQPRFHLAGRIAPMAMTRLAERFPTLLHPDVIASAENGLWLLRPDGYVAVAAAEGDIIAIERYLTALQPKAA